MSWAFLHSGSTWFLKIETLAELNQYMDKIWSLRKEDLFCDLKRRAKKMHPISDIETTCYILAKAKNTDLWTEFQHLKKTQWDTMTKAILADQILYVNPAGGYQIAIRNVDGRYESEHLRWPVFKEEDIRVKTWPGGVHYYAYIGPVQVKDGDTVKWDTEQNARTAAMKYITRKQVREMV